MNERIQTMCRLIGQETLITMGCGAMIEDRQGISDAVFVLLT
ncbi:hypothetical protein NST23_22820 [Brevibacillus sp. FSL K6-0770]|nr:hypothetical protein [Brevibacillus parabrevis]